MHVSDDNMRYHLLCGAFAQIYAAQIVGQIDSRITNRQIIMAGGGGGVGCDGSNVVQPVGHMATGEHRDVHEEELGGEDEDNADKEKQRSNKSILPPARIRSLPLLFS